MNHSAYTDNLNPIQQDLISYTGTVLFHTADSSAQFKLTDALIAEAAHQTVLPLIYSAATPAPSGSSAGISTKAAALYNRIIASNVRVEYEHTELHELLTGHNIPYVILKGCASGYYYPDAILRTYGDVDFLVHERDIPQTLKLLTSIGFTPEADTQGIHIACHRDPGSVWEMHRQVNGIPSGNNVIARCLSGIIETAVKVNLSTGSIRIPDSFHHCLVLLLHTASHLTSEGIGLRHLCDWAVFAEQTDISIFKQELIECGLWKFAQILSLVSVKYLKISPRPYYGTASDELLDSLMTDIMTGGNFGKKNASARAGEIKYIKNRSEGTVDQKSAIRQVFHTISVKARTEHKSIPRVCFDYARLIVSGKRKLDNTAMIAEADHRKKLYSELHLFE